MSRDGARTRKCPRRSRDSSPRNIHVAAAAAPRLVAAKYPRRSRGGAAASFDLRPRRRYGRESGRRPQARSSTRSGAFPASPSPTSRTRLPTRPTTPKGSSRRRSSFYWCWRFRSRSWSARASTRARGTRAASRASARVALSANRGRRRRRRWPFEPSRGRRRIANLGSEFLTRVCCAFKLCVYSGDAVAARGRPLCRHPLCSAVSAQSGSPRSTNAKNGGRDTGDRRAGVVARLAVAQNRRTSSVSGPQLSKSCSSLTHHQLGTASCVTQIDASSGEARRSGGHRKTVAVALRELRRSGETTDTRPRSQSLQRTTRHALREPPSDRRATTARRRRDVWFIRRRR